MAKAFGHMNLKPKKKRKAKLVVPEPSTSLCKFNYDMTAYISQDEARAIANGEFPDTVASNLKALIDDHVIMSMLSFEAWYRDRPKLTGFVGVPGLNDGLMRFRAEDNDWQVPMKLFDRFADVARRIDEARVEPQ